MLGFGEKQPTLNKDAGEVADDGQGCKDVVKRHK